MRLCSVASFCARSCSSQKPGALMVCSSSAWRCSKRSGSKVITDPGKLGPDLLELLLQRAGVDGHRSIVAGRDFHERPPTRFVTRAVDNSPRSRNDACQRRRPFRTPGTHLSGRFSPAPVDKLSRFRDDGCRRTGPIGSGSSQAPWQRLYFLPEPHQQGSLRPMFWSADFTIGLVATEPPPATAAVAVPPPAAAIASAPASDSCS